MFIFAIVNITIMYDLGFDKQLSRITNRDMYTAESDPIHRAVLVLYHRCHLRDKVM
jgi:hypothetical protein